MLALVSNEARDFPDRFRISLLSFVFSARDLEFVLAKGRPDDVFDIVQEHIFAVQIEDGRVEPSYFFLPITDSLQTDKYIFFASVVSTIKCIVLSLDQPVS